MFILLRFFYTTKRRIPGGKEEKKKCLQTLLQPRRSIGWGGNNRDWTLQVLQPEQMASMPHLVSCVWCLWSNNAAQTLAWVPTKSVNVSVCLLNTSEKDVVTVRYDNDKTKNAGYCMYFRGRQGRRPHVDNKVVDHVIKDEISIYFFLSFCWNQSRVLIGYSGRFNQYPALLLLTTRGHAITLNHLRWGLCWKTI